MQTIRSTQTDEYLTEWTSGLKEANPIKLQDAAAHID